MIDTVLLAGAIWLGFNVLFGACFIYPVVRDRHLHVGHRRVQRTV